MICPHCKKEIPDTTIAQHLAAKGGRAKSDKKAASSRENGKRQKRKKETP